MPINNTMICFALSMASLWAMLIRRLIGSSHDLFKYISSANNSDHLFLSVVQHALHTCDTELQVYFSGIITCGRMMQRRTASQWQFGARYSTWIGYLHVVTPVCTEHLYSEAHLHWLSTRGHTCFHGTPRCDRFGWYKPSSVISRLQLISCP